MMDSFKLAYFFRLNTLIGVLTALLLTSSAVAAAASDARPQIKVKTNLGDMLFELYPDKAPKTVENFLKYVKNGSYNDTIFHRVVNRFVIQGGGFTRDYKEKPGFAPIKNEADNGLRNDRGTIAMARTYDPDSATNQFFINLRNNKLLNFHKPEPDYYGYTVFGKILKGEEVLDKIGNVPTGSDGPFEADVPKEVIVIEEVSLVNNDSDKSAKSKDETKSKAETKAKTKKQAKAKQRKEK